MRVSCGALISLVLLASAPGFANTTAPSPSGRHVKLLTIDTKLAADGSAVETIHAEVRAENAAAAMSVGQSVLPFDTSNQSLEILDAYTRKANGHKIPVDVGAIYDQLPPGAAAMPMVTDAHVKDIVFPQFSTGDTAVYTARLTTKHAIFPGQFWSGDLFPTEITFDEVRETLTAPVGVALYFENHGVGFEKTQKNGQATYRWHYSAKAAAAADTSGISPLAHIPRFFVTTFRDYAALGRAYAVAAAPETAVTPTIQALAQSITKGTSDRREEVRKIYQWVAEHVRYVAIELGKGTLIPHPADTILANGYGDCKDHVALLAALLQAKGIASEAVLLNALSAYTLTDVPTLVGLDHVVTYVPSLGLILDSSAAVGPFGILPFQEYGKPAVYASETAPHLGTTPPLPPGVASVKFKTVSRLSKDGVLSGTTTTTATGPYSILLRLMGLGIQTLGPDAAAKRVLAGLGYGADATGTLQAPVPTGAGDAYTVTGTFSADGWSSQLAGSQDFYLPGGLRLLGVSGDGLMGAFATGGLKPEAEIPCYSGQASEELSLEAPPGARFASVPADTHVKTANIGFDAHWTLANRTLSVHRSFASRIDHPFCTAAIRAANAQALRTISDSYNVQISFASPGKSDQPVWYASQIAAPPRDPKLAALLNDALAATQHHEDNAAIAALSKILAQPDLPISASYPARFNLASLYAREGQYQKALPALNAALALTPDDQRMLLTRAHVYYSLADSAHALADCNAVLRNHPTNVLALDLRADIDMEDAKYRDAIRDFTWELQGIQDGNAYVLRAVAYYRLGRTADALADVATAESLGDQLAKQDFATIRSASHIASTTNVGSASPAWGDGLASANDPGITPPRAANEHSSKYPPLSWRLGEAGGVEVAFVVRTDGSVANAGVRYSSGFPALDAAAVDAVRNWRYYPAQRNGKPLAVRSNVIVSWKLTDESTGLPVRR
ncbi:MAG TPA: TonB family protein [Rhizomicrobium sp.]